MAKAEISPSASTIDGCICLSLNALPQRDGATGWYAFVLNLVAMNHCHVAIVLVVDSLQFLRRKNVVERYIQLYILHVRCDGMHLCKQSAGLCHFRWINEECFDESVWRYV